MRLIDDASCPLCQRYTETVEHLLFSCEFSQAVLIGIFPYLKLTLPRTDWRHWVLEVTREKTALAKVRRKCLAMAVYLLWHERSCRVFHIPAATPTEVSSKILSHLNLLSGSVAGLGCPPIFLWMALPDGLGAANDEGRVLGSSFLCYFCVAENFLMAHTLFPLSCSPLPRNLEDSSSLFILVACTRGLPSWSLGRGLLWDCVVMYVAFNSDVVCCCSFPNEGLLLVCWPGLVVFATWSCARIGCF
ncbi:hypothetical protein Dimus_021524 [Dionaea muscipula]